MTNLRLFFHSLSLSNLLSLPLWATIFAINDQFSRSPGDYLGAALLVLILAVLFFAVNYIFLRLPLMRSVHLRACLLLMVWGLIALTTVKPFLSTWFPGLAHYYFTDNLVMIGVLALAILSVAGLAVWRRPQQIVQGLIVVAYLMTPFAFVTFGKAVSMAFNPLGGGVIREDPTWSRLPAGVQKPRVVTVLFDEFDFEIGFPKRPASVEMPEMDRLRKESFFSTQAYAPMHSTAKSVPAMLTGRLVTDSKHDEQNPGDKKIEFFDQGQGMLSEQESIFSDVRAMGKRSLRMSPAYLPNFRIAGRFDADTVVPSVLDHPNGVLDGVTEAALISLSRVMAFFNSVGLEQSIRSWTQVHPPSGTLTSAIENAVQLAVHSDADLIYLHLLLPHLPTVYDAENGRFSDVGLGRQSYLANLSGVDRVFQRMRRAMEEAGRWDSTTVIIKADHYYRRKRMDMGLSDHRVPLIVKFAGGQPPMEFSHPFNLTLYRSFVALLMSGQLRNGQELGAWITQNATFGESPLTQYRQGW
ncbi:MAG: sulfatase-like hydrolase/transferase [Magnetococcales bacterium]|nr:sulfatase-like hydrolase/transferase [Magnetococcales bacterium]